MLRRAFILLATLGAWAPASAAELGRVEPLGEFDRDLAAHASPLYQAGRVFAHNPTTASFWVRDPRDLGAALEKTLTPAGASQSLVVGVAAGFDGGLAAAVSGIDARGRSASAIVWMNGLEPEIPKEFFLDKSERMI